MKQHLKCHKESYETLFGFMPFGVLYAVVHLLTRVL